MAARVVVVGSLNADVVVRAPRWPGPGETVLAEGLVVAPGGKGLNQAAAARRIGADVAMVGLVGDDPAADRLLAVLDEEGIDRRHVGRIAGASGTAVVLVAPDGSNRILVAPGANGALSPSAVEGAREALEAADVLLVQAEVPLEAARRAAELARSAGVAVVFNPAPAPAPGPDLDALLALADVVVPNEAELRALTGAASPAEGAAALRARGGGDVLVTLGAQGVLAVPRDGPARAWPAYRVPVVDTVGAGDAFVGTFAAVWAEGRDRDRALRWALAAAALACTRPAALPAMPRRAEVEALLRAAPA